jgi:AmiR/NasT family two-component response regulator
VKNLRATRVLIADMPRMLREMVSVIVASEPRFKIVGVVRRDQDLSAAIRRTRADIVIVGERNEPHEQTLPSIRQLYGNLVKVIAVSETGHEVALYQVHLDRTPQGTASASSLLDLLGKLGAHP